MYFHLTWQKFAMMVFVCFVLYTSLAGTAQIRADRYGSTPAFASVGLALQEIWLHVRYAVEGSVLRGSQLAGAAFGFVNAERTAANSNAKAIPVLTYHRIVDESGDLNNVTAARFRDQMLTLKRAGWETITLREYLDFMNRRRELPERSFLITFDDGAKESFYPVDPLFKMLGYEGVMYVIAQAPHIAESTYYLSEPEIKRMLATGRWEIGSHSYDGHRPYSSNAQGSSAIFFADKLWIESAGRLESEAEFTKRVQEDLIRARSELESTYGVKIDTFAFPLGNETGVEGAANFPAGASITEREAAKIYTVGFLQNNNQTYTFNHPISRSFIARRIHVDYDWSGERLLEEMENGLPKNLPYEDDFSRDRGWLAAWGTLDLGRNNLSLQADRNASSASAFLDGSALWKDYSFDASARWTNGSVFLLANLVDSKTYDSCAFSEGSVRIQSMVAGNTKTLAEKRDSRVARGNDVRIGIRVHDAVIECTWNYESILEAYDTERIGGIGVQIWNPEIGTAALQVSNILVRPYAASSTNPS
ncbi:hypothetical protein COU18_01750 [Candidatus Kaiserbacteria bacterium CG10_big_fil_rev_8_21_14_0_10_51_14]|uniref:NodB homology domain-containing protein n=1 Tax=Candidatus Kaiserbacteria bacterium CG10_big_fil_rev_8_21_14_0_10_51_14 TaxID=1974610 RepID=A0A2H0UEJ9_9BACT|nr:MAG: hypothetical protein COU18_01750 [Candidatus Kaiserbacteria bacterium CG10_big_fil_rev_8_21_14_0_10_51_14]